MKSISEVRIGNIYKDKRGVIYNILNKTLGSCLLINSKKNSIRANHYHKKDWHYCYILKGKIDLVPVQYEYQYLYVLYKPE